MRAFVLYDDEEEFQRMLAKTILAHNFLVDHRLNNDIDLWGTYKLVRVMMHIHGYHRSSRIRDFWYAYTSKGVEMSKWWPTDKPWWHPREFIIGFIIMLLVYWLRSR